VHVDVSLCFIAFVGKGNSSGEICCACLQLGFYNMSLAPNGCAQGANKHLMHQFTILPIIPLLTQGVFFTAYAVFLFFAHP